MFSSEVKLMEVVVKRKQNDLESGDKEQPQVLANCL